MLDYLQKFNALPKDLRSKISAPEIMSAIEILEKKYKINLAAVIMRVMTKELSLNTLDQHFIKANNLKPDQAKELDQALEEKVFVGVKDSLISSEKADLVDKLPAKDNSVVSGSNFFFSPEDEEDIRKLASKIDNDLEPSGSGENLEHTLAKIITQAGINFGSEHLLNRFKDILKTYLREVRNKLDTRQTLMKDFASGGLGFDGNSVDKLLTIVEETKKTGKTKLHPPLKIKLPEDQIKKNVDDETKSNPPLRDADYDLATALKNKTVENKAKPIKTNFKKLDVSHELAPPPPAIRKPIKPKIFSKLIPVKKTKSVNQSVIKPKVINSSIVRPDSATNGRQKMQDVRRIPKVMNPIDELRYLDLVSFHRLGPDSISQTAKIKDKLSLLEEEQYSKKIEGIKAWRQSPVNGLYITIGQDSINQNKPINDIIEARKSSNQDYLSSEEFKAIMDLNKELRF